MLDDYDGGCITEADLAEMYPTPELRAAHWRREALGIDNRPHMNHLMERSFGDVYLLPVTKGLPPGDYTCWRRGTWAPVPISWLRRADELRLQFYIEAKEREEVP